MVSKEIHMWLAHAKEKKVHLNTIVEKLKEKKYSQKDIQTITEIYKDLDFNKYLEQIIFGIGLFVILFGSIFPDFYFLIPNYIYAILFGIIGTFIFHQKRKYFSIIFHTIFIFGIISNLVISNKIILGIAYTLIFIYFSKNKKDSKETIKQGLYGLGLFISQIILIKILTFIVPHAYL